MSFAGLAAKDSGLILMEFDSKHHVFAVYDGDMIMDSLYICHIAMLDCVPWLCQSSCQVFWSLTINLLYRVFSKGIIVAVCLLSIDTKLEQPFQNRKAVFENMYTCTLYLPSSSPPSALCILWIF